MNAVKHMMGPEGFGEDLPPFMQMIEWHFVEELEHRTVAFDVYDHVCGGYWYRLAAGIWAQWHFTSWIRRVTKYMLKTKPPRTEAASQEDDRLSGVQQATVGSLMPGLLRIYMPNYSPHHVEISPGIQKLADKYSAMALETS